MKSKLALAHLDCGGGLATRRLERGDLPAIAAMLQDPEVSEWYGDDHAASLAEIAGHIDDPIVSPFLVSLDGAPLGYLQAYHANAEPFWDAFGVPKETYGLDMFLGARRGLGHGRALCRAMIAHLFTLSDVVRVQIDPDHQNPRAIHAYTAAGFTRIGSFSGYYPGETMVYMTTERVSGA